MTGMSPGRWDVPLPARPAWLDMLGQPCMATWSPRTCPGAYDQRSPIDHRCMLNAATPHVCQCWQGCRSPEDRPADYRQRQAGGRS